MSYPNDPDFTSASDGDAWWLTGFGNPPAVAICSSGGRAFVDNLQTILDVTRDGQWGPGTQAALIDALQSNGASAALIAGAQNDQAAQTVGVSSVRGAIFLMHQQGQAFGDSSPAPILAGQVQEGSIAISPNAVLPQWSVAAPMGPSGDLAPVCFLRDKSAPVQPTMQPPGPTMQPIPQIDIQVPPPAPFAPTQRPNMPAVSPNAGSSTSGWVLGAIAVAAIGGGVWYYMKNKPARANPTEMTERDRMREREREKAKKWFKRFAELHGAKGVGELGDDLVLGDFDWREWFNSKPTSTFMNELDQQRMYWEQTH